MCVENSNNSPIISSKIRKIAWGNILVFGKTLCCFSSRNIMKHAYTVYTCSYNDVANRRKINLSKNWFSFLIKRKIKHQNIRHNINKPQIFHRLVKYLPEWEASKQQILKQQQRPIV